jgi:hypothetical protein
VLRQKGAVPPPARHSADQLRDGLDAIGFALQLGFHEELLPLCEAVAEGTLDDSQRSTVAGLRAFFEGDSEPSKREALDDLGGAPDGVRDSLLGALEFAVGNDELAAQPLGRAAATLPDTQARLRALMELAALEAEAGDESEAERAQAQAAQIAPHLEPELRERVRDRSSTAILLASQLSLTRQPQHEAPRIARLLGRWARNPHG